MRSLLLLCIAFLWLLPNETIFAQNIAENEIVVIQGEKFVMHHVRTGETIYSLTKKYGITSAELEQLNPSISQGLTIGQVLKLPYSEGLDLQNSPSAQKGDPSGFIKHKIESKSETAYSIAKKYGITVEELHAYNPTVRKFKKRTELNIPFWEEVEEVGDDTKPETVGAGEFITHQVVSGETLYSLAKKYGTTEQEIIALNPGAEQLKTGMILKIKSGGFEESLDLPQPIENSGKRNYTEHIIESGETMWGTTRKYNVSEEELKALNPILNTGFPAGAVIKIPIAEAAGSLAKPVNEEAFDKHLVEKGETLYGLSKQYNLSIPDIIKYNPILDRRNLGYGETILIPKKPEEIFAKPESDNVVIADVDSAKLLEEFYAVELPVEIPESCVPDLSTLTSGKTYNVALFLPFFYEANDTLNREDLVIDSMALFTTEETEIAQDTTIELEERKELFKQFYGGSENFVQFYEGVLLSIDSIQKLGFNVQLNVFDTQRNKDSIRQYFQNEDFFMTDLIIGPIFPNVQQEIAAYAAKNQIPIISPLASQTTISQSNPKYFQVNPSRDYLIRQTAEMVAEEHYNSNFIIVKTSDYSGTTEGQLVELLREKFFNSGLLSSNEGVNFTIYDFQNEGAFGLRRIMSKTKENVVYIPSENEGELSVAISNINNLSDEFSITLIGTNRYPSYASIQLEQFHNLKLKYIAPYYTDYTNQQTINFVEKYKNNFGTEPDNFGFQGYDVTLYFLTALITYGSDFAGCLPYMHTSQVQGNYHFEQLRQFGGYMNEGVSVISYTRDFEVKRKRVKGQPRLIMASDN
ncbi:LysM peptidoglycan-binding domain-containing protein [Draconibacterium sp. IB214405]|uniref:PBP1 and LysM peptidoglycan-binding domain-containing protein n=1 Tax=Draconibacterium sp. IB214405 TaxID=3097352 RepID=UPI002A182438|nr:LysM peptidoglycan-binding domain-containing protein [Draconibacterium sp. IB214405]MDX8339894.1 LysM peptidoglycan-binding domain-containing protein [Draconibacterium sp. IB214405]